MTRSYRDIEQYQLGSSITNSSTTLTLGTLLTGRGLAGLIAPFTLTIQKSDGTNREVVNVNSTAGFPTLGIDRALNGTSAVSHDTTELVTNVVGENDLQNLAQLDGAQQAGSINVSGSVSGSDVTLSRHLLTSGSAPALSAGAGLGTTPPTPTVAGNDTAGVFSLGTGTATPANGIALTVTFATAFATAPKVVNVLPANSATALLTGNWYVTSITTTGFSLKFSGTLAVSQAAGTYTVGFTVIG